jgi:hypothetical protein
MFGLRCFALEAAVRQINNNPKGAGFRVKMKPPNYGRSVKWVEFEVIKTNERQEFDAKLRDHEKQLNLFDARTLKHSTYESAKK